MCASPKRDEEAAKFVCVEKTHFSFSSASSKPRSLPLNHHGEPDLIEKTPTRQDESDASGWTAPTDTTRARPACPPLQPSPSPTQGAPTTTRHAVPVATSLPARPAAAASTSALPAGRLTTTTTSSAVTGAAAELAAWGAHARAALDLVATTTTGVREEVASELGSVRRLLARARAARETRAPGHGLANGWATKS